MDGAMILGASHLEWDWPGILDGPGLRKQNMKETAYEQSSDWSFPKTPRGFHLSVRKSRRSVGSKRPALGPVYLSGL